MEEDEDKGDDSNGGEDSDSDKCDPEDDMDRVMADDGKELDDDIYAEEGYSAL
jgi:hypothetical protein